MSFLCHSTKQISLGNLLIGGGAPISIQSMTTTRPADIEKSLKQINELAEAGCQIVRLAVPDMECAKAFHTLVKNSPVPLIADIHFDAQLALQVIKEGVQGLRINPGNIGSEEKIKMIAESAKAKGIIIRVGSNSGSIKPLLLNQMKKEFPDNPQKAMAEALVVATLEQCHLLEKYNFTNIKVSLKSSDVKTTVMACQRFAQCSDYPQHIGITEAGTKQRGIIKSSIGIGTLLLQGIGDTLRVSLTANPVEEVHAATIILECCGIRKACPEIVSCPTCGRCQISLQPLAEKIEQFIYTQKLKNKITINKIAIMGCAVNGPGEARDADLAICGAKEGTVILFKNGKTVVACQQNEILQHLEKFL